MLTHPIKLKHYRISFYITGTNSVVMTLNFKKHPPRIIMTIEINIIFSNIFYFDPLYNSRYPTFHRNAKIQSGMKSAASKLN